MNQPEYLQRALPPGFKNIKQIIAVGSGKGGVGKSTVSSFLAAGLKQRNFKVGLLDADIYGPSQLKVFGAPESLPQDAEPGQMMKPIVRGGVGYLSMAAFKQADSPTILRAPMVVKWLQYFMGGVDWGDLDYLIIDLPPGTGDIQLTMAQQSYLSGAVIVTTANELAVDISRKGLKMFQQVGVPIVGVVDNMSSVVCSSCTETTEIFRGKGGERLAEEESVGFLGKIPLDPALTDIDEGIDIIFKDEKFALVKNSVNKFIDAFLKNIEIQNEKRGEFEPQNLNLTKEGALNILWDNEDKQLDPFELRTACPCAACVDEVTGKPILDPKKVPLGIKILNFRPVGRYGVSVQFSDGHNTGIYRYDRMRV